MNEQQDLPRVGAVYQRRGKHKCFDEFYQVVRAHRPDAVMVRRAVDTEKGPLFCGLRGTMLRVELIDFYGLPVLKRSGWPARYLFPTEGTP